MALRDTQPKAVRKGKPITENPLFPAVVALWFGALFGLGSLAIRVGLIEQVILAAKLDTIFAAAAPPLGVTARILLALVLAVFGAALGMWVARKIAAPKPVARERKRGATPAKDEPRSAGPVEFRARDSHPDAPARRPISAHEELGGAEAPVGGALAGRRRSALAIEHDDTFELHENAPLPGSNWQNDAVMRDQQEDALELGDFADATGSEEAFGSFDPPPPAPGPQLDWQAEGPATTERQIFQPLPAAEPEAGEAPAAPLDFTPPDDALAGRQIFGMAQPQPDAVLDELGITDAEFEELTPLALPVEPEQQPADLNQLGMVDLAAKLASSMERRRERAAAKAAEAAAASAAPEVPLAEPEAAAPPIPAAYEPPVAEVPVAELPGASFLHPNDIPAPVLADLPPQSPSHLPPVFAAPSSAPVANHPADDASVMSTRVPAALRPIALGTEFDEDDDFASLLPPRSIAMPAPAPFEAAPAAPASATTDERGDEPADETRFSSLLDVNQPLPPRQDFVRIEEPTEDRIDIEPVVIFPGQAARLSAQNVPSIPSDDEAATFRRFDSPGNAEYGQASTAGAPPAADPAETEKALRAALANLQRMSGAA